MAEMYGTVTTNAYDAAMAQYAAGGPAVMLAQLAVGDSGGVYYEPSKTQTALHGEKWRGPCSVAVDPVNPKKISITAHIPASVGGFQVREAGIFSDSNVMMLASKQPLSDKVDPSSGTSKDMTIRIYAEVVEAGAVEIVVDPSADAVNRTEFLQHTENQLIHRDKSYVLIPKGSDIPPADRMPGMLYLKVTDVQATIPENVRVSPNMTIRTDVPQSRSGIDFT